MADGKRVALVLVVRVGELLLRALSTQLDDLGLSTPFLHLTTRPLDLNVVFVYEIFRVTIAHVTSREVKTVMRQVFDCEVIDAYGLL